ncbi:MAG: helix-turn-helix transcriptional regulator [Ruminococcaceae bacterium]|nr:helix-turn-helix transcriptional regulator [Oscillospiraceae bacterium]
MKLLIGEKISYYRKQKNMTQEQLANQIGISAQAVSGWEREVGYPDITLLPGISHALGISIDELMGNDEIGVNEDIKNFYERFWRFDSTRKLNLALEYYHKYPEKYEIADTLIRVLSDWGFANAPKHFSLMREACTRIIEYCTDSNIRFNAVAAMSRWAEDDEAERWLNMNPKMHSNIRGEVLEERLLNKGKHEEMKQQRLKNNLSLMLHAVSKTVEPTGNPKEAVEHYGYLRKLIQTFGEKGDIPDGWLCKYAYITMKNAAGLFGAGRIEEGFELFEEAMRAYKKHFELPDGVPLSLGAPGFFGDIAVKKYTVSGLCDSYTIDFEGSSYYMQNAPFLYHMLTEDSGLQGGFENVRNDSRFKKAVEEAKSLADEWRKKRGE